MLERPIGAQRENADWYKGDKKGPLRKAVGDIFGLGAPTVGRVGQGTNQQGVLLASSRRTARRPRRQRDTPYRGKWHMEQGAGLGNIPNPR